MLRTLQIDRDLHNISKRLAELRPQLKGASILITGASGFFGKWLCLALDFVNQNWVLGMKITAMSRDTSSLRALLGNAPGFNFENRDIFDIENLALSPHFVVHAATPASDQLNRENPAEMFRIAFDGSRRVIDWCVSRQVRRILFTSSGAVYGAQPESISHIPESYTGAPDVADLRSSYGEAKRAAELYGRMKTAGTMTEFVSARCFAFVGPGLPMDTHFAVGNFLLNGFKDEAIVIKGDGTTRRSYMHTEDLTVWLLHLLIRGGNQRSYNVGSDQSISIAELAEAVRTACGSSQPIQIQGVRATPHRVQQYVPDVKRAQFDLGLELAVPLGEALERTLHWLKESKNG